jgi:hypothetical protein
LKRMMTVKEEKWVRRESFEGMMPTELEKGVRGESFEGNDARQGGKRS